MCNFAQHYIKAVCMQQNKLSAAYTDDALGPTERQMCSAATVLVCDTRPGAPGAISYAEEKLVLVPQMQLSLTNWLQLKQ